MATPAEQSGAREPNRMNRLRGHQATYAVGVMLVGVFSTSFFLQGILQSRSSAITLISPGMWREIVRLLALAAGNEPERAFHLNQSTGELFADIPLLPISMLLGLISVVTWLAGATLLARKNEARWSNAAAAWGTCGWVWWWLPGLWEFARIAALLSGLETLVTFLLAAAPFCLAISLAGWIATFASFFFWKPEPTLNPENNTLPLTIPASLWVGILLFVATYTALNWQLYWGLLVPHGDSAMYEEHLWNITHGKGFRSYLDGGLFLGEHIQLIHLLLVPLHLLWPSHLLLELCEAVALGAGTIAVYRIAARHSHSKRAGMVLAAAYLLYFPLHFLEIAVDLKSFRPISFGVPLLLFAIDQMELKHWKRAIVLLLLTLSAKEDFALVIAPLGLWFAFSEWRSREKVVAVDIATTGDEVSVRRRLGTGTCAGIMVFSAVYLVLAVTVFIPYFRGGEPVHYTGYFDRFGNSPAEIVKTALTKPGFVLGELVTVSTVLYAVALLAPLGFIGLRSPGRLMVAAPLFCILCLNQVAQDPRHHFHAPLIPIVFWAAAAGIGSILVRSQAIADETDRAKSFSRAEFVCHFVWASALGTALFFSLSPIGLGFWDPYSRWYWQTLYVPGERTEMFAKVIEKIPQTARVASTDFVHPRFTHHERSYDYSGYKRKVSEYELTVPEDTDYIVIDTQHRYSEIKHPEQIREYREEPEKWKLWPDETNGYFIVLERVDKDAKKSR